MACTLKSTAVRVGVGAVILIGAASTLGQSSLIDIGWTFEPGAPLVGSSEKDHGTCHFLDPGGNTTKGGIRCAMDSRIRRISGSAGAKFVA